MLLLPTKSEVRELVRQTRCEGRTVGLVPTMGYLHEGHLSLARAARLENDLVVMSIFVNPTQFGPNEDFDRYPRDLERDAALAEEAGVDVIFNPEVAEMYANDHRTWVEVEKLGDHLCGASRPGHFRGVTTVVTKLFGVCSPDRAYFGQKDAQQAFVLRRMTRDLDLGVEIVICPTVREPDGLAMSSRNVYLSPEERRQAPAVNRALKKAQALYEAGERDASVLLAAVRDGLAAAPGARLDYVELVGADELQPVSMVEGPSLIAVAVWFGRTRLIDNVLLGI